MLKEKMSLGTRLGRDPQESEEGGWGEEDPQESEEGGGGRKTLRRVRRGGGRPQESVGRKTTRE